MGRLTSAYTRALTAHWQAIAHLEAARQAAADQAVPPLGSLMPVREVVARLGHVGTTLGQGWLAADLGLEVSAPPGTVAAAHEPQLVRVGEARLEPAGGFPALVPLLGGTHLTMDAVDGRNPRVAALLRTLTLRLVAACQPGLLRALTIDQAALGAVFLPLRPLVDAGVIAAPATSDDTVRRVLDEAEAHVRAAQSGGGDGSWLVLVAASVPDSRAAQARLAALTHAGPSARVCLVGAGWPQPKYGSAPPELGATTRIRLDEQGWAYLSDPAGGRFSAEGRGLAAPVALDGEPPTALIGHVTEVVGEQVRRDTALSFVDLVPPRLWTESSVDGLRTVIGRAGRSPVELAFDDATPHWLVGGRTGSGKTVFLLDVLYSLAARYSPDELALYLLDFKEGVSFTEFTPTPRDPAYIPHALAVGVESDREYGVAVLRELRREMNRRAVSLKRHAVTRLSDLRRADPDTAMPRIVAVIDEFQVLFDRNDHLVQEATALLEELARKGRSYGIHLILASQTISGVEALYTKGESIFGQFPLRVALPGGSGILDALNKAADNLALGSAVINPAAGIREANQVVRFPDAHADRDAVTRVRHRLWENRSPTSRPPAIFEGYATRHVADDPTFKGLVPGGRRPLALVGRQVDVSQSTAFLAMDATPGRHLAIVGTTPVGADVLHAATLSLARQHAPQTVRFLVAPLVAAADEVADDAVTTLQQAGHEVTVLDAAALRDQLGKLADPASASTAHTRTYLALFGMDAASAVLGVTDPTTFRTGLNDLQTVLHTGPAYGIHLLGWWRGLRRLQDDIGGSFNRDDIACLVALNVPANELGMYLSEIDINYEPRPNRALLVDLHDQRRTLIVPFTHPDRLIEEA